MDACYHRLTDEEKERNKHGPMHVFTYTPDNLGNNDFLVFIHGSVIFEVFEIQVNIVLKTVFRRFENQMTGHEWTPVS